MINIWTHYMHDTRALYRLSFLLGLTQLISQLFLLKAAVLLNCTASWWQVFLWMKGQTADTLQNKLQVPKWINSKVSSTRTFCLWSVLVPFHTKVSATQEALCCWMQRELGYKRTMAHLIHMLLVVKWGTLLHRLLAKTTGSVTLVIDNPCCVLCWLPGLILVVFSLKGVMWWEPDKSVKAM